ncbi:unnamed protein product [Symbiodinium natans]|uniref:Uncharacterized protein n=1 Tax=Symbiodinium natans TaxID=878477 RepID=A0A812TC36_9DINO|nr:unnamed protein product [Symbiodinium natans]
MCEVSRSQAERLFLACLSSFIEPMCHGVRQSALTLRDGDSAENEKGSAEGATKIYNLCDLGSRQSSWQRARKAWSETGKKGKHPDLGARDEDGHLTPRGDGSFLEDTAAPERQPNHGLSPKCGADMAVRPALPLKVSFSIVDLVEDTGPSAGRAAAKVQNGSWSIEEAREVGLHLF